MQKFYFTFGSSEQYPYTRGEYVIVIAEDYKDAALKFKEKYPNPFSETIPNCAFYYAEDEWNNLIAKHYEGKEPADIIGEEKAKLRIKVDYEGTHFFTNVNDGCFKEHESLELAKEWLDYNGYKNFELETVVQFSY